MLTLRADVLAQLEKYNEARDTIMEALALSNLPANSKIRALCIRASIENNLGHLQESVMAYEEARLADPSAVLPGNILREEIDVLQRKDAHELIMTLKNWTPLERLTWMTWRYDEDEGAAHETFRDATIRTQNFGFLLEAYQEAIELLDPLDSAAPIQCDLANAHWRIRADADATRATLDAILDSISYGYCYALTNEEPTWILCRTINLMSDVIYEQFRSTNDLERKEKLLTEMKSLTERPLAHSLTMPKSDLVHHMVLIARMSRKIGPGRAFYDGLQTAFALCHETLNDSVGWNDAASLESLAEVLLAVNGKNLEKEARIALSARFSELEPESSSGEEEESDGNTRERYQNPKNLVNGAADSNSSSNGYNMSDYTATCNGICDPKVVCESGWHGNVMYRCLTCYDCDLCESCYALRLRLNRGEASDPIKPFCSSNHRYIKGPIEGWKGMKAGKMYIGDEEIPFKDWVREVKDVKWKQVWDVFWTTED